MREARLRGLQRGAGAERGAGRHAFPGHTRTRFAGNEDAEYTAVAAQRVRRASAAAGEQFTPSGAGQTWRRAGGGSLVRDGRRRGTGQAGPLPVLPGRAIPPGAAPRLHAAVRGFFLAASASVRRPEGCGGDVGQGVEGRCGHLRDAIHLERPVRRAVDIRACGVEGRAGLDVVLQVREVDRGAGYFVGLQCVLIERVVEYAEVFEHARGLGAFARAEEVRDGDGGQQGYDRDHDHDFHQGKTTFVIDHRLFFGDYEL